MSWFDSLLYPIMVAVAWIMVQFHSLFAWLNMNEGVAWVLSIVGLTIVMRALLIPLFVKQIRASRGMQLASPEIQEIQKKYKNRKDQASQQAMLAEVQAVYKKHGSNPLASCMPMLAQSPVFFALFRVLMSLQPIAAGEYVRDNLGPLDQQMAQSAVNADFFGAFISDTFSSTELASTKLIAGILVALMIGSMFITQRQLSRKNMPKAALQGQAAQMQKIMLWVLPGVFLISGFSFPIGVLVYWTTTNLWTMGQQYYVIKKQPVPGSLAYEARQEKLRRKGKSIEESPVAKKLAEEPKVGQRQQPKRQQPRSKRKGGAGAPAVNQSATPAANSSSDDDASVSDATAAGGGTDDVSQSETKPAQPKPAQPKRTSKRKKS